MSIKIKKYLILPLILFNLTSCSEDNVFFFCDLNADSGGNCFSDLDYPGKQANAIKFLKTDNGDNMDGYYVNIYIANTYYYHNRKENMVINYEDIEIGLYKKGDDECLKSYVIDADYFSSFENCIANKNEDAYNSNSIIESDFSIKYTFNLLEFFKDDVNVDITFLITYKNSTNYPNINSECMFEMKFIKTDEKKEIRNFGRVVI